MTTRNGKIARLPQALREELNRRIADGEQGEPLLHWLNALPETRKILAEFFGGRPLNKQNLSEWRLGGFREWRARQEWLEQARALAGNVKEPGPATEAQLTERLAQLLTARYATLMMKWTGKPDKTFERKARALRGLCQDVVELRRGEQRARRLAMEEQRRATGLESRVR